VTLSTIGYGRWPTKQRLEQMIRALKDAGITTLVDVRHSPCPSNQDPNSIYGPRPWHLLDGGAGLDGHLKKAGIDYVWLVELGNPQKTEPTMAVLRAHLAADKPWPVNRGLDLLRPLVEDDTKRVALLCACGRYDDCHRKVIAEAYRDRFGCGSLELRDL
jgi:uncharacterized protein (DUF488 family)